MSKQKKTPGKPSIGGQAVLEGVMMRSPKLSAIAVRTTDGSIHVESKPVADHAKNHPWMKWPVVRGVVAFVYSLIDGVQTISQSADMLGETFEDEEPSKFEKWLAAKLGKDVEKIATSVALVLGVLLAVGIFVALPSLAASLLKKVIASPVLVNVLEGVIRLLLFVGYIALISRMKEIHRVFQYHGAEHKAVYCYEHDLEMTVENCRRFPRLHPRCGTAFLFIVMIISLLLFTVFGFGDTFFVRFLSRLLLMPVVAGVSYEALQYLGKHENLVSRVLRWPGLQMQRLTTKEPDDEMLQVAIAALLAADGRPWKTEQPAQSAECGQNAGCGGKNSAADGGTEAQPMPGKEIPAFDSPDTDIPARG